MRFLYQGKLNSVRLEDGMPKKDNSAFKRDEHEVIDPSAYHACLEQLEQFKIHELIVDELVENAYEGMVIVDADGCITKFNYEKLLGLKEADVLGRHVSDVIENTEIPRVIKTGKAELGEIQNINGHDMIVSRIPIQKNGHIIGAVGTVMFRDIKEVKYLAQKLGKLESKVNQYKSEIDRIHQAKYSFENIITSNPKMIYLIDLAKKASDSNSTILIEGESGTGKEYFAHAIHKASYRKYGPFIRINCAAIPKELIESELFGYEEGAFTGAKKSGKIGKFELANGGTLFLDEIGTLPLEMQVKLLRVLEEREVERVGGHRKIDLDIRVIAATNEHLDEMVRMRQFREDLYYRLNVIKLSLPPLRERQGDIGLLANHLLDQFYSVYQKGPDKITSGALELLRAHSWPGNVRELRNVIERAVSIAQDKVIYSKDLPEYLHGKMNESLENIDYEHVPMKLKEIVAKAEIEAILDAIRKCDGNKSVAAQLLGIHRTALYKKMTKYGLEIVD